MTKLYEHHVHVQYWDTCEYQDGVLNYNQDTHRQRTVNWCDTTGGTAAAFDFTTKGATRHSWRQGAHRHMSAPGGDVADAGLS